MSCKKTRYDVEHEFCAAFNFAHVTCAASIAPLDKVGCSDLLAVSSDPIPADYKGCELCGFDHKYDWPKLSDASRRACVKEHMEHGDEYSDMRQNDEP